MVETPPFEVTFVPVRQSRNNRVGNVSASNANLYLTDLREMFPIAEVDQRLHAEFVTNRPVLQSDDGNRAWGSILSELNALRVAEGSSRHYYGVVSPAYASGRAGVGYVGTPTALGWDRLPGASDVAAHEWGHNVGRRHSPGCGASNPDPAYPYPNGGIGVWGARLSAFAFSPQSPSTHRDFMTYCAPDWISDYVYESIMEARQAAAFQAAATARGLRSHPAEPPGVGPRRGREDHPRARIRGERPRTAPVRRRGLPRHRDGSGGRGGVQLLLPADSRGRRGTGRGALRLHPATVGIRRGTVGGESASTEVREPWTPDARSSQPVVVWQQSVQSPTLTAGPFGRVSIGWNAATHPMALIRDPATGQILAFARDGLAEFVPVSGSVEITLSDGVRSTEPVIRTWR